MKYKVGDEVLMKAEITDVHVMCERPYYVVPNVYREGWVSEKEIVSDKTYEQGLSDAWELADKLNRMPLRDVIKALGVEIGREDVFSAISAEEALAKIEAYEREKEIKVGDVVTNGKYICVVTNKIDENNSVILYGDGCFGKVENKFLEKTGKHIDIGGLLRQIGE